MNIYDVFIFNLCISYNFNFNCYDSKFYISYIIFYITLIYTYFTLYVSSAALSY